MKEKEENKAELEKIAASVTRYYDSLTDEEVAEDRAWGDFAATQFPDEEPVNDCPSR
jgi:hypothetical protein